MPEGSHFAHELTKFFNDSSLTVDHVVRELNDCGFPVPLHTFNYWLQGYFLPRSESAFQLVAVLEGICSITDNRLANALLVDLSSGSSFVPGASEQSGTVGFAMSQEMDARFPTGSSVIDWEANLIQKAVHDEIWVSADYKYIRHRVGVLARVPAVPNPTFVFQVRYGEGERLGSDEAFYDLSGIKLRTLESFDDGDMTVVSAQFSLPDTVVPGDLHSLSYSCDYVTDEPIDIVGQRFLPWALDFYSCKVTFEGGIPDGIRYATFEVIGDEEIEIPSDIPLTRKDNTVSISIRNNGNHMGAFYC
ncbi:MAG: hypothetical protein IKZ87_09335 [Actinomycetaceae bacterium]|nr:hypothetical protein [Actinomycetaceae bacterium]